MKRKQLLQGIGAFSGMLLLILDAKTALQGAQTGIDLCLRTVIPSLFPFFVLSTLLTYSFSGISSPILRPLGKICGIPEGAEPILLSGFLGGYPVGAQCIANAYRCGQLSRADAQRMLAFCNNVGPAFLFGMVASVFPHPSYAWLLWGIHIGSALLTAYVLPHSISEKMNGHIHSEIKLNQAIKLSLTAMANVCGWVILFRVIIGFLQRWILWIFPEETQSIIYGILELSNGCVSLPAISNVCLRFLVASGILAFGGLCVTMQTSSVTAGLSLRWYYLGKVLQTVFSLSLAFAVSHKNPYCFGIILLFSLLGRRRMQKKSSIHISVGV